MVCQDSGMLESLLEGGMAVRTEVAVHREVVVTGYAGM